MSDIDEPDIPVEPLPLEATEVEATETEAPVDGSARPSRRALIATLSLIVAVIAVPAFALTAHNGGHARVSVRSPDTEDPTGTVDIVATTSTAEPTTAVATSTTVDPTTTPAPATDSTSPTPPAPPSSDTTPTTAPPTTDAVSTTTTLPCPDDGSGGPGCPPITPLPAGTVESDESSCAVASSGQAYCWGSNDEGQLGTEPFDINNVPEYYSLTAVAVPGVTDATTIAVGGAHACVIVRSGDVWCWGADSSGQIGNGAPTNNIPDQHWATRPVAVPGIHGAISIAAGIAHTCATLQNGTVWCWGADDDGQLGTGDSGGVPAYVPGEVVGINNAAKVSAGLDHTCALLTTGTIKCWGDNTRGALGDGATTNSATPVAVSGITHAVQVDLGQEHTCALLADGHVQCWGYNDFGQLGDGNTTDSSVPVTVAGVSGARAISTDPATTCAIVAEGSVLCWGTGQTGELGDGTWTDSLPPRAVVGITDATAIGGHDGTTCVSLTDESLRCWGWNSAGTLGDGEQARTRTRQNGSSGSRTSR